MMKILINYKKMKKIAILTIVTVLGVTSCKSQYDALLNSNDVDAKYAAAFDYFNNGKYQKAATLFESMSVITSGTERDDTVQYYWGLSNYKFKDYYTAETNFARFAENFPRSPFAQEARFLRIDCLYRSTLRYELDPTPTYNALSAISEYNTDFPDNPHRVMVSTMMEDLNKRLDTKAYESARLYFRMEDYKAARVALKNVLKDDAENIYREDILYYIAKSSYKYAQLSVPEKKKERYITFSDDYLNFIGEMPDSHYRRELDMLYSRAQRAMGRKTSLDDGGLDDKVLEEELKVIEKSGRKQDRQVK